MNDRDRSRIAVHDIETLRSWLDATEARARHNKALARLESFIQYAGAHFAQHVVWDEERNP
jgi:hypothetical protein